MIKITKLSFKVAIPVILAGTFSMLALTALNPTDIDLNSYIIISLLCIFVFFYGLHVGQTISFPVKKILKKAVDLTSGDLKTRFYIETKDEFGQLAQIFNKIAEELEKSRLELEKSQKAVDLKVHAQTYELQETINALEQKVKNRTIELQRLMEEVNRLRNEIQCKEEEIAKLKKNILASRKTKNKE